MYRLLGRKRLANGERAYRLTGPALGLSDACLIEIMLSLEKGLGEKDVLVMGARKISGELTRGEIARRLTDIDKRSMGF